MTVQFIGVVHLSSGATEPNRFANKHLFILDKGMTYEEMKQEAIKITQARKSAVTPQHNAKFGSMTPARNTVLITNNTVFEEMKAYVQTNLAGDDHDFNILMTNGLVMTVNSNTSAIENCSDGGAIYVISSARIKGGVKDVYHYKGWTKVTNKKLEEDSEFIIPWWMDLHDQESPGELRPTGLPGVVPR